MFPEIIQKFSVGKNGNLRNKNNVAFLISEFEYLDGEINLSDFLNCFNSKGKKLSDSIMGINSVGCGELINCEKLKNCFGAPTDEVKILIAKLEYPYVAALVRDPI